MIRRKNHELMYKYLISYLCILFVPIAIIWFFTNNYYVKALEKEVVIGDINRLSTIQNIYDGHFERVFQTLSKMSNNSVINEAVRNPSDKLNIVNARKELVEIVGYDSFIYEVGILLENNNRVLTSSTECSLNDYINYFYKYEYWSESDIKAALINNAAQYIRPSEKVSLGGTSSSKDIISYLFSYPVNSLYPTAKVMFLVDQKAINNLLSGYFQKQDENIMILDDKKRVITETSNEAYIGTTEFQAYIDSISPESKNGFNVVNIDKTNYLISYVQSPKLKWLYLKIVPYSVVMDSVQHIKSEVVILLLLCFVIGFVLILVFTKMNYNPIRKLKDLTDSVSNVFPENLNELERVEHVISDLSNTNTLLNTQINSNIPAVKEFYLLTILKGQVKNLEVLKEKMESVGIKMDYRYYTVALFSIDADKKDIFNTKRLIEATSMDGIRLYCREELESNNIVTVINMDNDCSTFLKDCLSKIQSSLLANEVRCTIAVGEINSEISEAGRAYVEAMNALEYRFIRANQKIILFKDLCAKESDFVDNTNNIEKLKVYTKMLNYTNVVKTIEEMLESIKNSDMPLAKAKLLCYDIVNTINEFISIDPNRSSNALLPDAIYIINHHTIDELKATLKNYILQTFVNDTGIKAEQGKVSEMLEYINTNCCKFDFSIQNMADSFNMTSSHLSHYFKDCTGQSVSQYITNFKMDIVKTMLVTTDDNLRSITEKIGLFDVSSFIRKFKQVTGYTPNQYRQLFQNKK